MGSTGDATPFERVGTKNLSPSKADIVMRRTSRGFTLIELLIVVVIIGVLAAIAIPKFQSTKGKANAATLKSDLRNLATAQEAYFYEHLAYTTNTAALNVSLSTGVTITWGTVGTTGWSAKITHPLAYPIECAMFMGAVPALAPATIEGQLVCQ
jgi:prepilin-type N-terminal cleavage/methylation domain-containing protein